MEFAESNSHNSAAEVIHLHIVPNMLTRKKALLVTQAVVRDMFEKVSVNVINIEHCAIS
jgi:hypothetical protein